MAITAILQLICGSVTIDLLDRHSGLLLRSWRPAVPGYKSGGIYQDSPLANGRRLVHKQRDNWIETLELELRNIDQDQTIRGTQGLRRFLELAADYWTNSDPTIQPDIPYIKARGAEETNTRYAVVTSGQLPEDDNPYGQPFFGIGCRSGMTRLTLALEHGPWQSDVPGTATCVAASAQQGSYAAQSTWSGTPGQSADDAQIFFDIGGIELNQNTLEIGYGADGPTVIGLRFPSVNVPADATIISAYISFQAAVNDALTDVRTIIYLEAADNPATFSTHADFAQRFGRKPTGSTPWPAIDDGNTSIEAWVLGNSYNTSSLASMVQLQVNRAGWVANNAMVFFIADNGSSSAGRNREPYAWDDPAGTPATLYITYVASQGTFGRAATCARETYTANHHTRAQLTHAYHYDDSGAVWSGNLIGAVVPFELLPNPVQDADIVYFGIDTSTVDSGPFSSIVFDIGTEAAYTDPAVTTWQYWNGGWVALSVRDNTDYSGGSGLMAFGLPDVGSVHWVQPSDWATTAVNGVTGYWVRCIVTIGGGGAITTPTQQNRALYTICWPYLEIAAAAVGGDLPALLREIADNESSAIYPPTDDPKLQASRLLVGLRSMDRGADFSAYINVCTEQNPAGITITRAGADTSFDADTLSPTGMALHWNPAGALAMTVRGAAAFNATIGPQYRGTYHAFLRGRQSGGAAGNILCRLAVIQTNETVFTTPSVAFTTIATPQALDMGRLSLPGFEVAPDDDVLYTIQIQASTTSGTPELYCYDLILLPVDEWAADMSVTDTTLAMTFDSIGYYCYLDIDSARQPRQLLPAKLRYGYDGSDTIARAYRVIANGPAVLQSGRLQRLWHFSFHTRDTGVIRSDHEIAYCHQLYDVQRYYSMRGAR